MALDDQTEYPVELWIYGEPVMLELSRGLGPTVHATLHSPHTQLAPHSPAEQKQVVTRVKCALILLPSTTGPMRSVACERKHEACPVTLADLTNGLASVLGPMLLGHPIEGVWHTSVVVGNKEYFFGGGQLRTQPPRCFHPKQAYSCSFQK